MFKHEHKNKRVITKTLKSAAAGAEGFPSVAPAFGLTQMAIISLKFHTQKEKGVSKKT